MAPRKSEHATKAASKRKTVKEAADAAEQRSGKETKAQTTTAKPAEVKQPVNPNDTDAQNRALFLHHLPNISKLKDALTTATSNLRNAYKTAKADGFLKSDFDAAFEIQGAEGEKKKKAAIVRHLQIAKWLGCDLGSQLDLFMSDTRVPATGREVRVHHLALGETTVGSTADADLCLDGVSDLQAVITRTDTDGLLGLELLSGSTRPGMSARRAISTALRRSSSRRSLPWMDSWIGLLPPTGSSRPTWVTVTPGTSRSFWRSTTDISSTLSLRSLRSVRRT